MARIRYVVLEKDRAKGSTELSGTETIDLPEGDILSEVTIQARSTGSISDNTVTPMDAIIKKIELLVDGSTVVKSLSGEQIRALEWYNGGPFAMGYDYWGAGSDNAKYINFMLYLGRFAGDTKCGLDLGAYSNPQLKITWDTSITAHEGITYDAYGTPAFTYSVITKLFDGAPDGFLDKFKQSREIDTWDITDSATHNTEIPRGYDLTGIMWRGAYSGINPEAILENIRLDFDNGKWVPLDMDWGQLWQVFRQWWPKTCESHFYFRGGHGYDINARMLKICNCVSVAAGTTIANCGLSTQRRPLTTVHMMNHEGSGESGNTAMWFTVNGFGPMQTIYIPMKELVDGATEVVPTTDYSRIDLKCTTGSASGTDGSEHCVAEYMKPNRS